MSGPPREKGGLPTALEVAKLSIPYRFLRFPQVFSRRRATTRRCVACGSRVTNRTLGGNDGRSALSGPVWCLRCADYPQQLLLALRCAP
jgi:hypothetical protein